MNGGIAMPPTRVISQFPVLKGLLASNQILAQANRSVSRISNLIYTKRGALKTCDGSAVIAALNGVIQSNSGLLMYDTWFQATNTLAYHMLLRKVLNLHIGAPTGLTSALASGGSLTSGTTYFYKITALDGAGGETTVSNETSATPSGGNLSVKLTWTAVTNSYGYNVYRSTSTGTEVLIQGPGLPVTPGTATTFTDTGNQTSLYTIATATSGDGNTTFFVSPTPTIANGTKVAVTGVTTTSGTWNFNQMYTVLASGTFFGSGVTCSPGEGGAFGGGTSSGTGGSMNISITPPVSNTTQQVAATIISPSSNSFSDSGNVALFPADPRPILPIIGIGGGNSPGGSGSGAGANGGVPGNVSSLSYFIQFIESINSATPGTVPTIIGLMGNGYPPQIYSDAGSGAANAGTFAAITNSFVPSFPSWLMTTTYALNSVVQPTTPNNYYYVCIQAGTSGGSQPAFDTVIGKQYSDKNIIWKNAGLVNSAAPPPPGAAHGIIYAGSLWVGNTSASDTSNGLDGPSAIRMSDVDNPLSWNPINTAFLDKGDGTQIQGFAAFTITAQGIPPVGSLVVFKDFSTFQVQGVFGAPDFAIQRVKTDLGCIAPRSIQFLPGFGIVRLAHLGVALFDGVNDRLISEEIRPYIFQAPNDNDLIDITTMDSAFSYACYGFQTCNPPMYCLAIPVGAPGTSSGLLTRILCYDMVIKCWSVIDLPFKLGAAVQIKVIGEQPISILLGGVDGTVQRWQAGDAQWYTGFSAPNLQNVNWSFRSMTLASKDADQRVYFRRIALRGFNTNSTSPITVTPIVGGISQPSVSSNPLIPGDLDIFVPIMLTGLRSEVIISGSGCLELQGLSFHMIEKPSGVLVGIS